MVDPHGTKHTKKSIHTHTHTHTIMEWKRELSSKLMKLHSPEF